MHDIVEAITGLAERIRADERIERPVIYDPRNLVAPCVLIEPPRLDNRDAVLCGRIKATFKVLVIGMPGTWVEFGPLAKLVSQVLDVLEDDDAAEWNTAAFVSWVPPNDYMSSPDPAMAYQITCEVYV
ncbi:hypothetical protein [Catenulispora rubra]|uniref:hypothetical protein n=1 Tax=Catenulispora rubra TaxID=280293 RepID=UPI00189225D0|nr:hypothetical protein [Catenulispora rubra]